MYRVLNINDIKEYTHYLNKLDEIKVNKFIKNDDRMRAIGSIILQKDYILSKNPDLDYKEIIIQYTEFGKPYYKELVYNISHDAELIIIVYFETGSVGVDIMKYKHINFHQYIDYFTKSEFLNFTQENFLSYWCAKEAFLKAIGFGFFIEMTSIEVINTNILYYNGNKYNIDFIEIPDYCCAVVYIKS
jgi:4'-phosphopantetheinyl transferase